ncbi:hypothetical protein HUK80_17225 [Flavobacterium sp. MAH-1]|uniref:histidine kinase n=1 Tax=Flavobacterium agri TaxID=2743471 RepID=A0A7Y8Y681_9FLAO|nr:HAMP domain-containing sensor histidine kinase [Flavobacterium agri]NUY82650.1 hypothetical protein [Flavobacterium agri]NYA72673.1 hypothetical protein [Flavobacterium agri]
MIRFLLLSLSLLALHSAHGQTTDLVKANEDIQQLIYDNKYNEAQSRIYELLRSGNIDKREEMVLYVFLSDIKRILVSKDEGMKFARKALAVTYEDKKTGLRARSLAYHVIANIHFEKQEYDSAYYYAEKSIRQAKKYSDSERYLNTRISNLPIIGYYFLEKGKLDEAEKTLFESKRLFEETDNECEIPLQLLKLADLEIKRKNLPKAERYALRAREMADSCSVNNYVLASYSKLIDIYLLQNDAKKMLFCVQKRDSLNHSKSMDEQRKNAEVLEARYDAMMSQQESKVFRLRAEAQESRNWMWIGISGILTVSLAVAIWLAVRMKQKKRLISRQKNEVERLNLLNRKIFSVISHDFKGPLHNLQGSVAMVEDDYLDAETFKEIASTIGSQTEQASLVLENLLNWAKSEIHDPKGGPETAFPKIIAHEIASQLEPAIHDKNLSVEIDLPQTLQVKIQPDKLRIIYRNLLSNAIKYSFEQGKITLGYEPVRHCLFVRDEGIGIDLKTLEKLFANAVDSGKGTHRESGYGIGLQITSELVRKSKGKIRAENNDGKGATIYFCLEVVNL